MGAVSQSNRRGGFTLLELLAVVATIVTLAALLLPILTKAKIKAQQTTCLSNLRQLGFAWTLYYGDAEAHLNIARRLFDSRTPSPEQLGTAWLPLPHLLMAPFVKDDFLWHSGLGGAIPSAFCLVIAGAFLFAASRRVLGSTAAGAVAAALLALNPNVLYLASAPMTEPVFFAALAALLYFTVLFRQTQSLWAAAAAGLAAMAGSLTRYEGWFLIPFAGLFFLFAAKRNRLLVLLVFGAIASLGPTGYLFTEGHTRPRPFREAILTPARAIGKQLCAISDGLLAGVWARHWLSSARSAWWWRWPGEHSGRWRC